MGASLVEATASTATSASAPTESAGQSEALAILALQLGPASPESSQRNRGIHEGAFGAFVATTTALSVASFCSKETVLTIMDSGAIHNFVEPVPHFPAETVHEGLPRPKRSSNHRQNRGAHCLRRCHG